MDEEKCLDLYLKELKSHVLTREEEVKLAQEIQAGNEEAKEKLIEHNLRLVVSVVKRHYHNTVKYFSKANVGYMDLISEGNMGLMKAIDRFDYKKGYKFSTYATWWIRQSIDRYIHNHAKAIRMPVHSYHEINKLNKKEEEFAFQKGSFPSIKELARYMDISEEKVRKLKKDNQLILSLDANYLDLNDADETSFYNFIADEQDIEEEVIDNDLTQNLYDVMQRYLSEREITILSLYYGLRNNTPKTTEEVGRILGITKQRVSQIQINAIRKIRSSEGISKIK